MVILENLDNDERQKRISLFFLVICKISIGRKFHSKIGIVIDDFNVFNDFNDNITTVTVDIKGGTREEDQSAWDAMGGL